MEVEIIAQLIKLRDYVSRYEWNTYRYPSQFIRLKQENWNNLYDMWVYQKNEFTHLSTENNHSTFSKLFSFFKQNQVNSKQTNEQEFLPSTELELRHYFLNKLFPLQLKWATSTVTDISFIDKTFQDDEQLKYFLQRFPDIYLFMYYPIFNIKRAPVDGEIIFISPIGIEIIYVLEFESKSTIIANDDRTWLVERGSTKESLISPLISLKRTEHIVQSILTSNHIEFPISKIVLSRVNHIAFAHEPYKTRIIGKNQYDQWFHEKRQLNSTLKSEQLRVAEILLKNCLSTSVKRPEWEEEDIFTASDCED